MNEWNGSSCESDAVKVTQARKIEISEWKIDVVNEVLMDMKQTRMHGPNQESLTYKVV